MIAILIMLMIILIPNPWQFKKLIINLIILFAPLPLSTPHFLFSPKPCGRALADGLANQPPAVSYQLVAIIPGFYFNLISYLGGGYSN